MHTNYASLDERTTIPVCSQAGPKRCYAENLAANGRHVHERQPRVPVGEGFGGAVGVGVGGDVGVAVGAVVGVAVGAEGCVGVGDCIDVGEGANVGVGAVGLGARIGVGMTGDAGPGALVTTR